uniref:RNA-directed DNA polymerase, eukaryota, reverse transcriptase zinc-binding domain protein n=1 Tax=Tanacetum cinerariifolium TaxID=118510 RepID=A0A699JGM9_TANCI|nr:RNA-directed DNA polymerase, eukaryota, reverse transcriptase zinc-binding domain protein [Tanacetum cinerariifolium]
MAKDLWGKFASWWEIAIPVCANVMEWIEWLDDLNVTSKVRSIIDGVGGVLLWHIWKFRNELIFSTPPPRKALIWDSIFSISFLWISSRNPKCNFSWSAWLQHPFLHSASM